MRQFKILKKSGSIFFHVIFLVITLIVAYPIIWTLTSSLKSTKEIFGGSLSWFPDGFEWSYLLPANWDQLLSVFQFNNYDTAWNLAQFDQYFLNTIIFSGLVVFIVVSVCALTGYVLGRYAFPGKLVFIAAIIATMFIPNEYSIIPMWQLINFLGLEKSLFGLVLAEVGGAHVIYILLFTAYFSGLPKELEDSASIDGAGFLRTFLQIMLPLAKPVIASTAILQFINAWNSFLIPLIFTIQRPDLRTLGVGMYSFVEENTADLGGMAAGASISFIPIIIVFLFFQRYFVEGIAGSVKG
ncbi:carbohydrate ABC transporter permease [Radiobacillus sp. PE A8.2]|uniref:carbohydrate ABC transporter permease n=1 Tax=Radiobacillus sp. PE A8.2 TaxID=3380349 RepID=UPI00389069F7